jgi:hypothetical protein
MPTMLTKRLTKRPLVIEEILAWAIAFHEATGKLPTKTSGGIVCPMQFELEVIWRSLPTVARWLPAVPTALCCSGTYTGPASKRDHSQLSQEKASSRLSQSCTVHVVLPRMIAVF